MILLGMIGSCWTGSSVSTSTGISSSGGPGRWRKWGPGDQEPVPTFVRDDGSELEAIRDVNLTIHKEEFICILALGCGKTTLLRTIAGLDRVTSGEIMLDGEKIDGPNPKIGIVFQEYSLFPWRNVIDNVAFGLEMQGMGPEERYARAEQYLDLVGLSQFSKSYPSELSGGMRQRVAARALASIR
jgi:NitT/TauT family transport system ATP-binding protein